MSQLNVDTIKNRLGTAGPTVPSLTVTNGINVVGVVTATSFFGSGSGLTGVGLGSTGSINTSGIITATSVLLVMVVDLLVLLLLP
jgi:hypothetical protein